MNNNPRGINQYTGGGRSGAQVGSPMLRQKIAQTLRKARNAIRGAGVQGLSGRRVNREAVAMTRRLFTKK